MLTVYHLSHSYFLQSPPLYPRGRAPLAPSPTFSRSGRSPAEKRDSPALQSYSIVCANLSCACVQQHIRPQTNILAAIMANKPTMPNKQRNCFSYSIYHQCIQPLQIHAPDFLKTKTDSKKQLFRYFKLPTLVLLHQFYQCYWLLLSLVLDCVVKSRMIHLHGEDQLWFLNFSPCCLQMLCMRTLGRSFTFTMIPLV